MENQVVIPADCPLCNGKDIAFRFNKQGIPYYTCRNCSFVFSGSDDNANLVHAMEAFEPAYLDYFQEKPHDKKNHDALTRQLQQHASLQGARILDVGCGSGKFVKYLRSKGYEAFGIEPSRPLFDTFLSDEYFFNDRVEDYIRKYPSAKFDIVILSDVLEHADKPSSFISNICSLLADNAILYISTPDTNSLFARAAGKRWHYYNKYHLSLFSRANLIKSFASHGLTPVASGKVTRYQSMYYITQYLFNFMMHRKISVPGFLSSINIPVNLFDNMYIIFTNGRNKKNN